MKIPTTIFLILLSFCLTGQNRYSFNLQIKSGVTGIEKKQEVINSYEKEVKSVRPGVNISVGIDNHYFLTKKRWLSLSAGLLYNYTSFKKKSENIWFEQSSSGSRVTIEQTKFKLSSLQIPIKIHAHLKQFRISGGIQLAYLTNPSLDLSETYYRRTGEGEQTDFVGEVYSVKSGDELKTNLWKYGFTEVKKINWQYTFGVDYQLSENIRLGMEYSEYFSKHYFHGSRQPDLASVVYYLDKPEINIFKFSTTTLALVFEMKI